MNNPLATSPTNSAQSEALEHIRTGRVHKLEAALRQQPSLATQKDDSGRVLLHWAASFGHAPTADLLLRAHPEQLELTDDMGWTALMIAASAGHLPVLNLLVQQQADVRCVNSTGCTPLHYAASKQHIKVMERVLAEGADVNAQDKYGNTPLHRAASKDQRQAVLLLLNTAQCQLNCADCQGNTALHLACEANCHDVAADLVKAGAHLDRLNKDEQSPLALAEPKLRALLQRLAASG